MLVIHCLLDDLEAEHSFDAGIVELAYKRGNSKASRTGPGSDLEPIGQMPLEKDGVQLKGEE